MSGQFAWKDDYRLGIEEIDIQHQNLFSIANRLNDTSDAEQLYDELMNLYRYTREHFKAEEALMRECGYPEYREHRQQHDELLDTLNQSAAEVVREPEKLAKLQAFMAHWVVEHILNQDQKIATYLKRTAPMSNP